MTYIPPPYKHVVLTDWNEIRCFNTGAYNCVWDVRGFVDKLKINPWGCVYVPKYQALLVADGENCRILVVNPKNGKVAKSFKFPDLGQILDLCLASDQICVWSKATGLVTKFKLTFMSLR